MRTAIELAYLGAKVVVVEKRDTFSRNNVLHLWPFTIHDLRGLGAKKFYGKFCAGSIDHISEWGSGGVLHEGPGLTVEGVHLATSRSSFEDPVTQLTDVT